MTPRLWLAAPTRFAALSRRNARIALALAAALILACFTALDAAAPPAATPETTTAAARDNRADVALYEEIVAGLRNGGDYYTVTAEALRRGPYPLRPFFTFRLPTLARVQAALPDSVTVFLLFALAIGLVLAWYRRFATVFTRPAPRIVATILLVGGIALTIRPGLAAFHEVWAGPLIALSLAIRRPGDATAAIAVALIAMLIRETAALYAGIMLLCALAEGRRREAAGWLAAIAVMLVVVAAHAFAVARVVRPLDAASDGWHALLGFGFVVKAMTLVTALATIPAWLAAPLVGLSLVGWVAWRDPLATRALATLAGYTLLLAVFCRTDTYYWAMLPAPILLVGLAFVPDTARDLFARALDRRRITVTRLVR
ncbi:MAG: hypothetical protein PGN08_05540 [Sphingomonas taxi]